MIADERNYLREYAELIETRKVVAGYWIKTEIRNLVRDLDDPAYIYDTTEAHARFRFEQKLCFQSKKPYYGKPIQLMPWQLAFWEALYSFKMADSGLRRFTEALLLIARKNGKSTSFAADAMYDLFKGDGGVDICCASNDDREAKLIWREIGGMRERLDPARVLTSQNLSEIRNKKTAVNIFRLSSKTQNKDGFNIDKTYLDESHDIKEENAQSEIAEACWRSMSTKDEPLFMNCTTQGFNRDCYLDHKIQNAKKVISGEIDNIHFLPFLYEQDSEAEIWQNPESWEKSNPSLRYGVKKIAKLRQDVEDAKHDKATRIHMLTKDFNLPQANAQSWLLMEDYSYDSAFDNLEDFRGALMLGAVDLSATTDLTSAKALVMKPGDRRKYILSHYWIPESKLTASNDAEYGAKYIDWAKEGILTIDEGNEVIITEVADWFFSLYKNYGLRPYKIGYDQRYAKTFLDRCEEYQFETEMLKQGRGLSSAMKLTEAELKSRNVMFGGHEMDKWCLGNCCCAVDNFGNIQPEKVPGQAGRRIDGALTLIMIYEVYRRFRTEFLAAIGG